LPTHTAGRTVQSAIAGDGQMSICYVVTWEVLYFNFLHGFMDKYGAYMVETLKASDASPAASPGATPAALQLYDDVHRALPGLGSSSRWFQYAW
jgi:hypothetical protein